jgi:hypothetical protein
MGFAIIIEVFKVPEGYKSFTRNTLVHHDDLLGNDVHKIKRDSVDQSIKDLYELMEDFDG